MAGRVTIVELLAAARQGLDRLTPEQALRAQRAGAVLLDVRTDAQVAADGTVPGARRIALNHLEWRLDPVSAGHVPGIAGLDDVLVLVCDQGYSSSLAAARLQLLGFHRATDVIGGFRAWRAAGLPVVAAARGPLAGAAG